MSTLAVTLTVDELRTLVRDAVAEVRPSQSNASDILTRAQVAKLLQIHVSVVIRYIRKEGLPAHKVGGEWRFVRSEVMAWVTSRKGAA